MELILDEFVEHSGVSKLDGAPGPGSGRYPLGSGDIPNQHRGDFMTRVQDLRDKNFTFTDPETGKTYTGDTAIARSMGLSSTQFRVRYSMAKDERRAIDAATAYKYRYEDKLSLSKIAEKMGFKNDSSVRSLLNEHSKMRMNAARNTAEFLKKQVDEHGMIDVGGDSELFLPIQVSREKMNEALYMLSLEGYNTFGGRTEQVTNRGKWTTLKVLCPPGTPYKVNEKGEKVSSAIYDIDNIHSLNEYETHDDGETFQPRWVYPKSMDPKRVMVRYAEDGGLAKDGVVEIRRGVDDVSLGNSTYAQVRVLVNGTHYIKGMGVYGDFTGVPDGVDMIFNTNKAKGTPMLGPDKKHTVLKMIKKGDNPFGSLLKDGIVDPDDPDSFKGGQSYYYDKDGKKQLSLINKRAEEGDWDEWAKKLPSQFLSKQPIGLIKKQLGLAKESKLAEYEEICALTNPTVKKELLSSFAEDCDSAAVHLKAAALPRQRYQVILPLTSIKDTEIYAPNYKDGEQVALVRYPHGGLFEIPILTVNNHNKEGKNVLGTHPKDAVGISKKTADQLSGADFDGDTVMVIPTGEHVQISNRKPFDELKDFDPKIEYGSRPGMKKMTKGLTQTEMGKISNLITDMTLLGAKDEEVIRAVKHSMVVIDAEKHELDYTRSEKENRIAELKRTYQGTYGPDGKYHEGAATLISRAKSQESVPKRRGSPHINQKGKEWYDPNEPEGALIYTKDQTKPQTYVVREKKVDANGKTVLDANGKPIYETKYNRDGTPKIKERTQRSTKMAEARDARDLISDFDSPKERAYADYANSMKALANKARKEMVYTKDTAYNAKAKAQYQEEVSSLNASLLMAKKNHPRERQAQLMAGSVIKAKKQDNPDMEKEEIRKESQRALAQARAKVGAHRETIKISDREWEAIQAGAISPSMLKEILDHADMDVVRQKAMPRQSNELSESKQRLIKSRIANGYTPTDIAEELGISASTVQKYS